MCVCVCVCVCVLCSQGDRRWTVRGHRSQRVLQRGRCQVGAQPSSLRVWTSPSLSLNGLCLCCLFLSDVLCSCVYFFLFSVTSLFLLFLCFLFSSSYFLLCVVSSHPVSSSSHPLSAHVHSHLFFSFFFPVQSTVVFLAYSCLSCQLFTFLSF